jgi:putative ABC transport system permease protein
MVTELLHIIQGIVERGLIFGIVVAGVYIASRLIRFDNLAVEGSFGLGGALSALLINYAVNPMIALLGAAVAGIASGMVTGLLYTKLRLNNLISGIVVTTALFSITLKIAGSNMGLAGRSTIFNQGLPLWFMPYQSLMVLIIVVFFIFYTIDWLLTTEIGFLLRAVGDSPQMLTNVGKSVDLYTIIGLSISNMFAAISGALFVQYTGYFSIWSNVGVLIIGLAGMILAQTFSLSFGFGLLLGSIVYQLIIALTFEMQLNQDWNKLITALLIVLLIVINQWLDKKREVPSC